jgi:hypothetical protein
MLGPEHDLLTVHSTTLFGVGVAIVGYACVAPLWFALHLWLSPTAVDPKDYQLIVDVPVKLAIAPISTLIGFGVPSLLMCLPAPNIISFEAKQTWAAIQQGWSIWIALVQFAATVVVLSVDQRASILSESDKRAKTIKYLRWAYLVAIVSSAGAHAVAKVVPWATVAFPTLFSPAYVSQLQPDKVFVPAVPFGPHPVKVLADGALWFLQWDVIVGVSSTLLWGVTLRVAAKHEQATPFQSLIGIVKIAIYSVLLGPCGAAALALWDRDELVFRRANTESKKDKST